MTKSQERLFEIRIECAARMMRAAVPGLSMEYCRFLAGSVGIQGACRARLGRNGVATTPVTRVIVKEGLSWHFKIAM